MHRTYKHGCHHQLSSKRFYQLAFTVGKSSTFFTNNGDTDTGVTGRILIILHIIYHISLCLLSELSATVDFPATLIVTAQVWLTLCVSPVRRPFGWHATQPPHLHAIC